MNAKPEVYPIDTSLAMQRIQNLPKIPVFSAQRLGRQEMSKDRGILNYPSRFARSP